MKIRKHSATNIPARWFSLGLAAVVAISAAAAPAPAKRKPKTKPATAASRPAPKPGDLAGLVRAWRESPSTARRAAIETYAARHANDNTALLARLALGVGSYEQRDFSAGVDALRKLQGKLPQLADYTSYYLAASRLELKETEGLAKDLAPVISPAAPSPLAGRAWIIEARALRETDAPQAIRILRDHYAALPQPEGDLALADCYQSAKDLARAAEFYQRIYYQNLAGDSATRAAAALLTLKDAMGASYPAPLPEQELRRADRLIEIREYTRARAEYLALAGELTGPARDRARVGMGAADFLAGKTNAAYPYLRGLDLAPSEAEAERLYYLAECARRLTDDDEMLAALRRLAKDYPQSPWRLRALITAANRYLLVNRPEDYVPLFRAAYENFPGETGAGLWHWKVAFQAYLRGKSDAGDLLREHLRNYPLHMTTGAALYFLGRLYESAGDAGSARACYQRLSDLYQNLYYAMRARERLADPEVLRATIPASATKFLAELKPPPTLTVPNAASAETNARIERSRLLRAAGLPDLADSEIRFGMRTDGQPALLAMEMAGAADKVSVAMRIMKGMVPDYLNLPLDRAPRKFWEMLFPLPYRAELVQYARERDLDPYVLAGLIRQESEFDPQALSHANAYGLTQVRPSTGRLFARKVGISRFNNRLLFQPTANLKIGSSILKSMLDQNGGKLEYTLAAYNAGPNRVVEWLGWGTYREPAEFVEAIPFTETRDYVQAVMRNADMYRRLYRQP